ncbi:MAG TPA: hypothetical protein VGE29_04755 [Prosthecobacter sp.]
MRQSTYVHASRVTGVVTRWRGMGAVLAVAFYSLFFAAHQQFQDTPLYIRDGTLFGASTQTVFGDLTRDRTGDHRGIGPAHPAFTLLHQPPVQVLAAGWRLLGQGPGQAEKHAVATLTALAGALTVVMVYHALLWSGMAALRCVLLATACGAGPAVWLASAMPEVWIFAGLGVAALAAVAARGEHAPWWLFLLAAIYAMGCFAGNVLPVLLLAVARCARESRAFHHFRPGPLLVAVAALPAVFGLANLQRVVFPLSSPLPLTLSEWQPRQPAMAPHRENAGRVGREVFLSSIVAPKPAAVPDPGFGNRSRVVLTEARWGSLDLQKGLGAAWLLVLALSFAGLVWRSQLDAYTLGMVAVLVWGIASLPWYGEPERLLLQACVWTPPLVIAAGLGLERSLEHWPKIRLPVTFLLIAFVTAQVTRNWMFLQEVASQVRL